jgi:hypothetical protein
MVTGYQEDGEPVNMSRSTRGLLGALVVIEVISAALAWRDLDQRIDDEVRGSKRAWRTFILMNPGNSLIYWAAGRK